MSGEPMSDPICHGGVVIDDNQHVRCLHCDDDLGPLKTDPDEQYEQVTPTGSCWPCVMGAIPGSEPEPADPTEADLLDDLLRARLGECPECHEIGACAYDAEGRPMIHVSEDTDRDALRAAQPDPATTEEAP